MDLSGFYGKMRARKREREFYEFVEEEICLNDCQYATRGELVDWLCEDGIFPALKRAKFVLGVSLQSFKQRLCHWWKMQYEPEYLALEIYPVYIPPVKHNGGTQDYEEFEMKLPFKFWQDLTKRFAQDEFFDDSVVGRDMVFGLQWFTWVHLSLEDSPHFIRLREKEEDEEAMQAQWEREHGKDAIRLMQDAEDRKRMGGGRRVWDD